jgi:hypothetical protein
MQAEVEETVEAVPVAGLEVLGQGAVVVDLPLIMWASGDVRVQGVTTDVQSSHV